MQFARKSHEFVNSALSQENNKHLVYQLSRMVLGIREFLSLSAIIKKKYLLFPVENNQYVDISMVNKRAIVLANCETKHSLFLQSLVIQLYIYYINCTARKNK